MSMGTRSGMSEPRPAVPFRAAALLLVESFWLIVTVYWWFRLYWPRVPQPPFPDDSPDAVADVWVSIGVALIMGIGCVVLPLLSVLCLRSAPVNSVLVASLLIVIGLLALGQFLFIMARLFGWIYV